MSGLAPGAGWTASFKNERRDGTTYYSHQPVAVWCDDGDAHPAGYVVSEYGKLRSAEGLRGFAGYEEPDPTRLNPWANGTVHDTDGVQRFYWLDVELVTGRRFEGYRSPDGDALDEGLISFVGREGDRSIDVRVDAIVAVTYLEPAHPAKVGS